jgi:hypothetical protein
LVSSLILYIIPPYTFLAAANHINNDLPCRIAEKTLWIGILWENRAKQRRSGRIVLKKYGLLMVTIVPIVRKKVNTPQFIFYARGDPGRLPGNSL